MRLHQLDEHASQLNDAPEVSVTEAGGYYTQPVYDMIEKHGYEKVMRELLASLHADVIQDFISRADLDESLNEVSTSGDYANVVYDYKEDFYMVDVYKDGKKVAEDNGYFGASATGNPLVTVFLKLVKQAGLEAEGLRLVSTGGDEPDETGVFKNGKFNWDKNSKVNESKMMTEAQFDEAAGEKDACYRKVKARYKVWPSAYASGALTKCRKVGAANWGNSKKK
tara:strand:+ start:3105 stop:3776 length:672 start_codon:yes stop_codon:yes gene_type:complete